EWPMLGAHAPAGPAADLPRPADQGREVAGFHRECVGFVSIQVQLGGVSATAPDQYVGQGRAAVRWPKDHSHPVSIGHSEARRIRCSDVHVSCGDDGPFGELNRARVTFEGNPRAPARPTGMADGRVHADRAAVSRGELHLGGLPSRTDDPNIGDGAFGTGDFEALNRRELTRLTYGALRRDVLAGSEKAFEVRLGDVNVPV